MIPFSNKLEMKVHFLFLLEDWKFKSVRRLQIKKIFSINEIFAQMLPPPIQYQRYSRICFAV